MKKSRFFKAGNKSRPASLIFLIISMLVFTWGKVYSHESPDMQGKRLSIDTPSKELQGFGIQAIPVAVSIIGSLPNESTDVSFVSEKGSFNPTHITVKGIESKEVIYRTESTGKVKITAKAPNLSDVSREFDVVFPWRFLISSLIGGVIGALIKRTMGKGNNKFLVFIGQGILAGFIVAVLWALGVNIFNAEIKLSFNEFSVLTMSILGALFWEVIYDFLKGWLVRGSR